MKYYKEYLPTLDDPSSALRIVAFTHVLFAQETPSTCLPPIDSITSNIPCNEYKTVDDVLACGVNENVDQMSEFNYWRTTLDEVPDLDTPANPISDVDISKQREEFLKGIREKEAGININRKSSYERVEYQLEQLEKMFNCKSDMASDVVGLKKLVLR